MEQSKLMEEKLEMAQQKVKLDADYQVLQYQNDKVQLQRQVKDLQIQL